EADYAVLANAGVTTRGRIALIRYGAEFRGLLAKRAQDHGFAGAILYSDPQDDGFAKGAVYPNGPYRPAGAVQRGTIAFNSGRLNIPVLPVSSLTARALLADMRGVHGPAHWAGALAVPYLVGQTRSLVHLRVQMRAAHSTLWNTVGELRGTQPESTVIAGAHRDAWVYGVSDDGSGIAALLETARGLGELHRRGWTPQRTIRLIGFDGEELGELGSHAYVNAHLAELQRGCVAYINVDEAVSGRFVPACSARPATSTASRCIATARPAAVRTSKRFCIPRCADPQPGIRRAARRVPFQLRRLHLHVANSRSGVCAPPGGSANCRRAAHAVCRRGGVAVCALSVCRGAHERSCGFDQARRGPTRGARYCELGRGDPALCGRGSSL